jgi:hypothetical protein
MTDVRLTLPLPPTANKYYRNVKSRTLVSKGVRRHNGGAA